MLAASTTADHLHRRSRGRHPRRRYEKIAGAPHRANKFAGVALEGRRRYEKIASPSQDGPGNTHNNVNMLQIKQSQGLEGKIIEKKSSVGCPENCSWKAQ